MNCEEEKRGDGLMRFIQRKHMLLVPYNYVIRGTLAIKEIQKPMFYCEFLKWF
jgi:hypothetical protein